MPVPRGKGPRERSGKIVSDEQSLAAAAGRFLSRSPAEIKVIRALAPAAGAVAAPLGNIDKLVMVDGGGDGAVEFTREA